MYRIPADYDWSFLHGLEVSRVCLETSILELVLSPEGKIVVKSDWLLCDGEGGRIDGSEAAETRDCWRIHRLLARKIERAAVLNDRVLELVFEGGMTLQLCDNREKRESFALIFPEHRLYV